jgi:hypothetical protein
LYYFTIRLKLSSKNAMDFFLLGGRLPSERVGGDDVLALPVGMSSIAPIHGSQEAASDARVEHNAGARSQVNQALPANAMSA